MILKYSSMFFYFIGVNILYSKFKFFVLFAIPIHSWMIKLNRLDIILSSILQQKPAGSAAQQPTPLF
jgi:hypothetical protein